MLTRIELDGFKTFDKFALTVRPFQVILGTNASGKSNLFDAIQMLSRLAGSADVRLALKGLRGEPHELFRRLAGGASAASMSLAVEVLLNPKVQDPYGETVKLSQTRLRYEVTLEHRRDQRGIERVLITRERAVPLRFGKDTWREVVKASPGFKSKYLSYQRPSPLLETSGGDQPTFQIAQDGKQGRKRELPARVAEATVLSSIRTAQEFPHLFALGAEMRSWQFLQLDPVALRAESDVNAPDSLLPNGANLPTVLHRIQAETHSEDQPLGTLADIRADMGQLITGLIGLTVVEDEQTRKHRLHLQMRDGRSFSAQVASEGTLRLLALLTTLYDPKRGGLICFEEPENGVHPAGLKLLMDRLRDLVTDPERVLDDDEPPDPLAQVLMNSHSPVVLSAGRTSGGMFLSELVTRTSAEGIAHHTRMRRIPTAQEVLLDDRDENQEERVQAAEVERYLNTVQAEG